MKNNSIAGVLVGIVLGLVVTIWFSEYLKLHFFEFTVGNLIILCAIIICFIVVNFIKSVGLKDLNKTKHSFGLPSGTVRAILALILIVFFVLVSFFAILSDPELKNARLVENIITTLATLVISVVSFYFGSKATEQGSEIANRIFGEVSRSGSSEKVPPIVIQEALNQKKDKWIKEFGCRDIKIGKKNTSDGQIDLDCLVFLVDKKLEPSALGEGAIKPIPSTISFAFQGKLYSIPTDVRSYSEAEGQQLLSTGQAGESEFKRIHPEAQQSIIREFIEKEHQNLKSKFPEIQGISEFKKNKNSKELDFYSIQFKISKKLSDISPVLRIPDYFPFKSQNGTVYNLPTDIDEEGEILQNLFIGTNSNPRKLGVGISRKDEPNETGTIGLKVKWNNMDCLLSCYHVICAPELRKGTHQYSGTADLVISPSEGDRKLTDPIIVGNLVYGAYSHFLDIALAKLPEDIVLDNELFDRNGVINGILTVTKQEATNGLSVKMVGRTSERIDGTLHDHFQPVTYVGVNGWFFKELIVCKLRSNPGDSGAVVLATGDSDVNNKVIGILIASSSKYSYLIRIDHIINMIGIQL
jgi:hypothetical protein